MKKLLLAIFALIFTCFGTLYAAPIKIAAALPVIGSIASYIGGDKVEVFSIAKGNANPHVVEVLPSYMIKVSRAAIYLKVGLYLDQWSDEIADGSHNDKLLVVDCSNGVSVLEKPGQISAIMGDVHPGGNPHYWLDPENGIIIAANILDSLKKVDVDNAAYYQKNFDTFKQDTENRLTGWKTKMAKLAGRKIIGYHSSWVYFAHVFNLSIAGYVEPLPGIPPTGKHLAALIDIIKKNNATILFQEPYFPDDAPQFLARETGIKVYKVSPSCADVKAGSYLNYFNEIIDQITK
jgi:zinc/manganese transport system substrate-binding protein